MASRPSEPAAAGHVRKRRPLNYTEVLNTGVPPPDLNIGDQIIWPSDSGPEYGVVKWLGKLPDVDQSSWMAGVEFVNPVGSGTGLYNDVQLFSARMNHASLVPLVGLIKLEDFNNEALPSPPSPRPLLASTQLPLQSTMVVNLPQKPRRTKMANSHPADYPSPASPPATVASIQQSLSEFSFPDQQRLSPQLDEPQPYADSSVEGEFGSIECPSIPGDVLEPPKDLIGLAGRNKGIQGHHNSCYLDATLFSMFSATYAFDTLLTRPSNTDDIAEYTEVQKVLREEIVNPLRSNLYVRADRVMKLRTLLDRLSSIRGLTSEEKDPEEFLNLILNDILKAEPYLKLSSGLESYFYQLFVERDDKLVLPTVQQLFDQSFLASDIKLREIPPCLLIQMPRFGRQFKMYPRIIPSLYLDITDVLENSPRQCCICGQVAEYECKECFGQFGEGLDSTAFCGKCLEKTHAHKKRSKHQISKLLIPHEFLILKEHQSQVPRVYMELFAVLCIETSHYVAFVKCGSGPDAPWCFFDSMADRKGEQNGYNIPEVIPFADLRWWLSDEGNVFLLTTKDDKVLPEMARRLLCDAYMCFYQSPDILMYR